MSRLHDPARIIWSLAASGIGTTLTASGNSGGYNAATPNACTVVDLRAVEDVLLTLVVNGVVTGTTPTLAAQLDIYDDVGNLIPGVLKTSPNLTAAGSLYVSGGVHGSSAASSIVLPSWGRISWTVGGTATPTFPGAEICLFGR